MYRNHIYGAYVRASHKSPAPDTINGLKPRAPYLKRLIRNHFPPDRDAAIVDLGCGHGALIHFARQQGYRNAIGYDRSPEQIAAARRLGIEGVHEGDLQEILLTFSDGSLDAVVAFDVIEHFRKDELIDFVDKVYHVLRPGGRWIIHTPNGESPFCTRVRYGDFTHELALTRESANQLLKAAGFGEVACYEDEPVPHGVKSVLRLIGWRMIRAGLRAYLAVETGDSNRDTILTQNLLVVAVK